jgi:hypothetical protein
MTFRGTAAYPAFAGKEDWRGSAYAQKAAYAHDYVQTVKVTGPEASHA